MDTVVIEKKKKKAPAKVPDYLIYETVKDLPIYYKGYKFVLNKTKTFDDITMDSTLQAWLKSRLTIWLGNYLLPKGYDITTGEQGLILSDNQKRGADIAIFKASNLRIDEHFSRIPPEVILEIDIKADTENSTELDYILEKLAAYHQFGVKNVIWIFTKNKKIMLAKAGQPWLTVDWATDVDVIEDLTLNLAVFVGDKLVS